MDKEQQIQQLEEEKKNLWKLNSSNNDKINEIDKQIYQLQIPDNFDEKFEDLKKYIGRCKGDGLYLSRILNIRRTVESEILITYETIRLEGIMNDSDENKKIFLPYWVNIEIESFKSPYENAVDYLENDDREDISAEEYNKLYRDLVYGEKSEININNYKIKFE